MSISASVVLVGINIAGVVNLGPGAIITDGLDRTNGTSSIVTLMHLGLLLQHARNAKESKRGSTQITGQISGLTPGGQYRLHVNQWGELMNGCIPISAPLNPFDKAHGGSKDEEQLVGDLGTVTAGEDGVAQVDLTDSLVVAGLIGRTLVLYADGPVQSAPVACGLILAV